MHEYSIVTALIEQCEKLAQQNSANKITRVDIKLGILSGVEPALLKTAFEAFKLEGICHDAQLNMQIQPLVLQCHSCKEQTVHQQRSIVCDHCLSTNTTVLDGEEMLLMQLELEQS